MRSSHFKIWGKLDRVSGRHPGTVSITRLPNPIISVRPSRRRRTYDLPLDVVADYVCARVIWSEKAAERRARPLRGRP